MHYDVWNSQNIGLAHIVKAKIKHQQTNSFDSLMILNTIKKSSDLHLLNPLWLTYHLVQSNDTRFETNYRLQITFNFHVHQQIVLQVAENVAQNESFVMSKVTAAPKVPPFDGIISVISGLFIEVQNLKIRHLQLFERICSNGIIIKQWSDCLIISTWC